MLLDAAVAFTDAGCCVIPVRPDGSKAPAMRWTQYQVDLPDRQQLTGWFGSGRFDGLGVVCGAVSGGLEMFELEGRAVHLAPALVEHLVELGAGDLWTRLCAGYLERSPSGGFHLLYRVRDDSNEGVSAARRNTKLAQRPATPEELAVNPQDKVKVLVETRGEGGYVVVAPSAGRTHETGQAWTLLAGGPDSIPTVSVDERDLLYEASVRLDQMPTVSVEETRPQVTGPIGSEVLRPGDDFNQRASWDDILGPHGWRQARKNFAGKGAAWTRPGKQHGVSATTGTAADGVDRLYVFSTSTTFETEKPYSKFAAYAHLEHGGDLSAAAAQLRADGYGAPADSITLTLSGKPPQPPTAPRLTVIQGGQANDSQSDPGTTPPTDGATALAPSPTTLVRSEDGHAHQLIHAYGELIRYCPQRGQWLAWDGTAWRWQPKSGGLIREYAKTIARTFPAGDSPAVTYKKRALSAAGITGCLLQAQTDARVTVDIAQLDADPWILNTPGGAVDLRTGQLHPPDPATLCTKMTRAAPDHSGNPTWDRFLTDTFGDDTEFAGYIQRLIGISLIGAVREQVLPFAHGQGANGKSTLLEAVMHALGVGDTGYAIAAPAEMLMIRKHSEHPAEIAQLAGARLVVCSELDDGQRFAEAKIKQLTGRDSLNARFLYGQPFTFTPSHTIWLLGNQRPQAHTGGQAFWRRVKLLKFVNVVPPKRRDPALGDKLETAAGAVLAWAVQGAVDYVTGGIREPASVSEATQAYAEDQDTIGRFVADQIHLSPGVDAARVATTDLRAVYEDWCNQVGERPATARRLTHELRDRFGVEHTKGAKGKRFYVGLTLLDGTDPDDPEPTTNPNSDTDSDEQSGVALLEEAPPREWWQR